MNETTMSKFIWIVLNVVLLIAPFIIIFVEAILNYTHIIIGSNDYMFFLVNFLRVCGILGMYVLVLLRRLFSNIKDNKPFSNENEKALKSIAVMASIFGFIFIFKMFYYPSILTLTVSLIFFFISISAYVFSKLFKLSNAYKSDIDLTI